MKHTYTYRGWYVFYSNSKYVAQKIITSKKKPTTETIVLRVNNGVEIQADTEDALLNNIDSQ